MKKWEYNVIRRQFQDTHDMDDALNEEGVRGWELISAQSSPDGYCIFIYKREKKEPED